MKKTEVKIKKDKEGVKRKVDKKSGADLIKEAVDELLKLMGTKAKAEVIPDKENESVIVDIKTEEEAGLLIGNRGITLYSLQSILNLIIQKKTGKWQRVIVNIAGWREKEERKLEDLAKQTAERVSSSGEPQSLYNLTSAQRRIVHMALSGEKGIKTESVGEGGDRYLVVSSK